MLVLVRVQGDIAAFKDYTAEDAKGAGDGGGAPKKQAVPESAGKKAEGKQETAPQQKPQQQEQKPAPSQPKQPSGKMPAHASAHDRQSSGVVCVLVRGGGKGELCMSRVRPTFGLKLYFKCVLLRVACLPAAGRVVPSPYPKKLGQGKRIYVLERGGRERWGGSPREGVGCGWVCTQVP